VPDVSQSNFSGEGDGGERGDISRGKKRKEEGVPSSSLLKALRGALRRSKRKALHTTFGDNVKKEKKSSDPAETSR